MKLRRTGRLVCWSLLLMTTSWVGCKPSVGGSTNNNNANGSGSTVGGGETGGFQDNGLDAPARLPIGVENLPPTGDLLAPVAVEPLPRGDVSFLWNASDPDETNVDSTLFISDQPTVFDNPLFTTGVRTSPDEVEHRLSVRFPDAGTFYWGVEITDGVHTIRRPATETGEMIEISEDAISRLDAADVVLLCPRATQPALPTTTFSWSLGNIVPTRTKVFVGRVGAINPFDDPLRILDVAVPTDERRTLSDQEALPVGEPLSWGLQIETADEVLFTGEGQRGEAFQIEQNIPPSGVLSGPDDNSVLADNTSNFMLTWTADSGNCEDDVNSSVFFELLSGAEGPVSLFESPIQLSIVAGVFQADLVTAAPELDFAAGTWAWGVLADDGTDQTELPHSQFPDRSYRTFLRNPAPRLLTGPTVDTELCGSATIADDAIVFSYGDDNGVDSVNVALTYATTEALVFDDPAAMLVLAQAPSGDVTRTEVVFLETPESTGCPDFIHGAGFYGVELNDGVNDPARSIIEFAGPPTGACCFSGGGCTEGTSAECTGGVYQGDDTTCALVSCPLPPPIVDCNGNGIADAEDIALENSLDCNGNGVPDECEGSPAAVDAGTLAPGTFGPFGNGYDSVPNGNDLMGTICPPQTAPKVVWTFESVPPGAEVFIRDPSSLSTSYLISPAIAGDYVFRLTLSGTSSFDTVMLTLTPSGP